MSEERLLTEKEILDANDIVLSHPLCVRTPLLKGVESMYPEHIHHDLQLYLKLENMQTTGSFKMRGVVNQMRHFEETGAFDSGKIPITMSAGNYGKAFATYLHSKGRSGKCLLPDTAPRVRASLIQSLGMSVDIVTNSELQPTVDRYVEEGTHVFCHPIDDINLIAGYASCGLEILEELPDPDIVLVCCGGGGLVSGISTAIKTFGPKSCRVYAVEPTGAPCMSESFKSGRAVAHSVNTVASGLAPPYAGKLAYRHCAEYVEGVLLVSDEEILQCVELLYRRGLVVEPSGAAAMAALLNDRVPDVDGKKVVVVITGGNATPEEMMKYLPNFSVFNKT